ncbi:MAG: protein translocase subunit SecD [Patescibacteria group bacterium]
MAVKNQPKKQVSKTSLRWRVFGIFILVVVCLLIVLPTYANKGLNWINKNANLGLPTLSEKGFNLGLDLQGGAHLIYQADTSILPAGQDKTAAVEGVRDVIERRVRGGLGVSEPLVQTTKVGNDFRIIVDLPGVTDVNQAIKMIGETPILEFKEQSNEPQRKLTVAEQKQLTDYNAAAQKKAQQALNDLNKGLSFTDAVTKYSEDVTTTLERGGEGLISSQTLPELYTWADTHKNGEISKTIIKTADGLNIVKLISPTTTIENGTSTKVFDIARVFIRTKTESDIVPPSDQWKGTGLSGKQLSKAAVVQDPNTSQVQVSLQFNSEGTKLFADITKKNVGKPVAIFLDGEPISTPVVNEPILNGNAVISGNFTLQDAKLLAQRLNSGALPVPVQLISQETVDATLGVSSLNKSFYAGIIGLIAVLMFMVIYYRFPGVLAALALGVYALLSLAIFKLIGVTLTLSGIAGFILSIGMAVDANVLIFERLKEELRMGKSLRPAMEEAFIRAWPSIRDSNITTLLSCVFLIWMGTGFVQGFAVVLAIGILASMFSAITVTRTLMRFVAPWFKEEGNRLFLGYKKSI